jgi:hypothetical protein
MRTIREELQEILEKANKLHSKHGSYRIEPQMAEWLRSVTTPAKNAENENPEAEPAETLKH